MTNQRNTYKRLSRFRPHLEGLYLQSNRLYLGENHLLLSTGAGFHEEYKRFPFADIQALIIRQTRRRDFINILFALCILGSVLIGTIGFSLSTEWIWVSVWGTLAGIFLVFLAINHLLGEGCQFIIQTAVQKQRVSFVNRVREARRLLRILRPMIQEAQRQ